MSVLPKLLRCDANPKGVKAETTGSIIPGSYQFTAEFVYVAPKPTAQITWEYKKNIMAKYTGTGGLNYASVSVGKPVSLGNNTYRVKTTLTLTNPPITIDTGTNHFYFRAKATMDGQTAYSSSADISVHYRIDISPERLKSGFPRMEQKDLYLPGADSICTGRCSQHAGVF